MTEFDILGNMEIRLIADTDFAACADTLINAFKQEPWNEEWTFENAQTRIVELMSSKMSRGYVVHDGNGIAAMCIGRIMTYTDFKELFIDEFSVHPLHQKKGIGGMLLNFAKEELRKEDVYGMVLNTVKDYPSVKFYKKNGFKILESIVMMAASFKGG